MTGIYDDAVNNNVIDRVWHKIGRDETAKPVVMDRIDLLIAACFCLIAICIAVSGFSLTSHEPGLLEYKNIWFQADIARVIDNMTNRGGSHWRTSVHPITSILLYPIGGLLTTLGLSPTTAARMVVLLFCALNGGMIFLVLRRISLPRIPAAVFASLFLGSAAVIFWSAVVELYPIACTSLLMALFLMAPGHKSRRRWWIIVSAFTLSITVTNWAAGLIATFVRWRLKPFLLISACVLGIVLALSITQFFLFKDARIFIDPQGLKWDAVSFSEPVMEKRGQLHTGWNPIGNVAVLYTASVVAPPARAENQGGELVETNQFGRFTGHTPAGLVAMIAWLGLLALGIWGAIQNRQAHTFSIGLGLMLLANGLLHSVYGEVTFLYAMHVIPMLTVLAAMSWFSPARYAGVALALVVIVAGGGNNIVQFQDSARLAGKIAVMPGVQQIQGTEIAR
ncbi:MAG: hypothetical protein NVV72_12500 [Asticcacaulis sp.]|nr:hypothetical protein [Asticcacaulis sp.]